MADFVSSIIHPKKSAEYNDSVPTPCVGEWLEKMGSFYMSFTVIASLCTLIVCALSIFHLYYVLKYVSNDRIQTDLYYLVFMYPVTSLCGTMGMFIPRAALFLYAVALVYYMLCLFVVVSLLFNIFGSRREMSEYLLRKNIPIKFRVPPVCCFRCLPKIPATQKNLRRCEWMVFQTPLVRCVLEVINVAVSLELTTRKHTWFMLSNLAGLISMCVAFYGCYVLVPLASRRLRPYRFGVIFRIVDVAQCLYTIQKFCFDLAANLEFIQSDNILSSSAKAQFWTSFMLTWEMLMMSGLTTYLLRPDKTSLFDRYPCHRQQQNSGSTETVTDSVEGAREIERHPTDKDIRFDTI